MKHIEFSDQYWLFGNNHYYPSGGLNDLQFTFNNQDQIEKYLEDNKDKFCDVYHLLNTDTGRVIYIEFHYSDWNGSIQVMKPNGMVIPVQDMLYEIDFGEDNG